MDNIEPEEPKDTLKEARDEFWDGLYAGKQVHCPCCDKDGKVHPVTMQSTLVLILFWLYRQHLLNPGCWKHVPTEAPRWVIEQNAVGKLLLWGLVDRMPNEGANEDTAKKCLGTYRINQGGIHFLRGEWTVDRAAMTYNDTILWWDERPITVHEALTEKFDYAALIRGDDFVPPPKKKKNFGHVVKRELADPTDRESVSLGGSSPPVPTSREGS